MNNDLELARIIKIKFGTDPNSPTSHQLEKIKKDIQSLVSNGITPSEKDWAEIVKKHCQSAGSYIYKGADNADLITLMQLATKK